jgi:hypothetical protein
MAERSGQTRLVMPGLVPGIDFSSPLGKTWMAGTKQDVDDRHKAAYDDSTRPKFAPARHKGEEK